jgi:hypothetical protein
MHAPKEQYVYFPAPNKKKAQEKRIILHQSNSQDNMKTTNTMDQPPV